MSQKTYELVNEDTGTVVFDGFPTIERALARIKFARHFDPTVRLVVRVQGSTHIPGRRGRGWQNHYRMRR